mmetsp:Transcript_36142/g.59358  ORF Transcript_36142/g.59358 Transcript_36142/m.59358 type:complete len:299 (-) Transcript_36142:53-949(-)
MCDRVCAGACLLLGFLSVDSGSFLCCLCFIIAFVAFLRRLFSLSPRLDFLFWDTRGVFQLTLSCFEARRIDFDSVDGEIVQPLVLFRLDRRMQMPARQYAVLTETDHNLLLVILVLHVNCAAPDLELIVVDTKTTIFVHQNTQCIVVRHEWLRHKRLLLHFWRTHHMIAMIVVRARHIHRLRRWLIHWLRRNVRLSQRLGNGALQQLILFRSAARNTLSPCARILHAIVVVVVAVAVAVVVVRIGSRLRHGRNILMRARRRQQRRRRQRKHWFGARHQRHIAVVVVWLLLGIDRVLCC